jgi:phosphoglycolate phosphatase-like HAD superfamily hydrolase
VIEAVVFDLDGVLVDSEQAWDAARKDVVAANGGTWREGAEHDMLGMSSKEWPVYVVERLGARLSPQQVNDAVVDAMLREYRERLPLLPGAREAVERVARRVPIGLASSSNREVIDLVLERMGVAELFAATVAKALAVLAKPAVMVGDRRHDVDGAHANGIPCIGVTWGIGTRAELEAARADALVARPADLPQALRSICRPRPAATAAS